MNSRMLDADYLREQYEALRREALAVSSDAPRGHGLMLFLTHGMVAWIEALSTLTCRHPLGAQEASTLPVAVRPEIATLLANMILVCMGEEQRA
jgi:hypothetical protein